MTRMSMLQYIFDNVNKWLAFAETKNGALVAFNSGVSIAIINLLTKDTPYSIWFLCCAYSSLVCFMSSAALSLFSFMPAIRIKFHFPKDHLETDNLYFYEYISKYDNQSYIDCLNKKFVLNDEIKSLELDLANQIITNSKIAYKKFWLFKKALWLTFAGVVSPILALFVYFLTDTENHK